MNNYYQNAGNPGLAMGSRPNQFNSYINPNTSTNNIIWVQGIEGAKAWQLNPNSMAILLDSESEGKMYIKVSDNIGMSSLRIFNYTEEFPSDNIVTKDLDLSDYVRKDELNSLIKELIENEKQSISAVAGDATASQSSATPAAANKKVIITKQ